MAGVITIGFVIAYQFVGPPPPRQLVLATGLSGGGYEAFGERYRQELARSDIELLLEPTSGSLENLERLRAGTVDVALVQGGTAPDDVDEFAEGLASVFYEPLWIFHRTGLELERLSDLAGQRIEAGEEGGGTRAVVERLLALNGVDASDATLVGNPLSEAADALLAGDVDAALFVLAKDSEVVARLMAEEGRSVRLFDVNRQLAYVRTLPFLAHVVLPEGGLDLARNTPPREIDLIAPTAALYARNDLHPALVPLLIEVAQDVHATGDLWGPPGTFPSTEGIEAPLSTAARNYFERGPSFLYRVFPFPVAATLDRLKIMLLPLLTLLLPLLKAALPLLRWTTRRKIYRWYDDLDGIEDRLRASPRRPEDRAAAREALEKLEDEIAATVNVPPSYMRELYDLRLHLDRMREQFTRHHEQPMK